MKIPLLALIFQGIPEQIAVVTLAFTIARARLNWKRLCLGGTILALAAFFLRLLPITFGVHTIVLIGILFFIVLKFGEKDITISIFASLLSYLGLIFWESICVSSIMSIFKIPMDTFFTNLFIRIFVTLPQVFCIFGTAFLIKKVLNKSREKRELFKNQ